MVLANLKIRTWYVPHIQYTCSPMYNICLTTSYYLPRYIFYHIIFLTHYISEWITADCDEYCLNWSDFSPLCVFKWVLTWSARKDSFMIIITLIAFVWFFSAVRFQMLPQIVCSNRCKVTLVAFVRLFSTVRFQMCPQIACMRRGIFTLVALVWLFSTVCFQMCPQIACLRGGIVTLVAFVWLFSSVCFQMRLQSACITWCKVTLVALVWLFSTVRSQMCPQSACLRTGIVALVAFVWFDDIVSRFLRDFFICIL